MAYICTEVVPMFPGAFVTNEVVLLADATEDAGQERET